MKWEKTFTIKEGGQREETLRLREAQLGDMLERISLPEFEVKDSAGNTVTCAELTKGGKKILMWLEESREPTEHILNEMLEHAEKFHEFEISNVRNQMCVKKRSGRDDYCKMVNSRLILSL